MPSTLLFPIRAMPAGRCSALSRSSTSRDKMAIFTLTGPLRVLQDFTSDPQILYMALQRYKPQEQEFASAPGQLVTSAASGTPSAGSTVAALDASTDRQRWRVSGRQRQT